MHAQVSNLPPTRQVLRNGNPHGDQEREDAFVPLLQLAVGEVVRWPYGSLPMFHARLSLPALPRATHWPCGATAGTPVGQHEEHKHEQSTSSEAQSAHRRGKSMS